MRRLLFLGLITTILLVIVLSSMPVWADDNKYTEVREGFSVDSDSQGVQLEKGSTINHMANGKTYVYRVDGSLHLKTADSKSGILATPAGYQKAIYVYSVPNGSRIEPFGDNGVQVFDTDNRLVLTVINGRRPVLPGLQDWVRDTTFAYTYIENFHGNWTTPSAPPNDDNVDYYFLGAQGTNGYSQASIVQPVLQWNQPGYEDQWTYQSWAVTPYGSFTGSAYQINQGNQCYGSITYSYGLWSIDTWRAGGSTSTLNVSGYIANLSVNPFLMTCLEISKSGQGTFVNNDVPGTCPFYNLTYVYNSQQQPITWTPHNHPEYQQLTTPTITYQGSPGGWVTYTTNY